MFDAFKARRNANMDQPVVMPGYGPAPSNPDQENLRMYRGVLAAGPGHVTSSPGMFDLFGRVRSMGLAVAIRPYRQRNADTVSPPYFFPH